MNRRAFIYSLSTAAVTLPSLIKVALNTRRRGPLQTKVCQNFRVELDPTGRYSGFFIFEEVYQVGPYYRFGIKHQAPQTGRRLVRERIDLMTSRGPVEVCDFTDHMCIKRVNVHITGELRYISREIIDPPVVTVSWREMENV